jgi:hypothetical protein
VMVNWSDAGWSAEMMPVERISKAKTQSSEKSFFIVGLPVFGVIRGCAA